MILAVQLQKSEIILDLYTRGVATRTPYTEFILKNILISHVACQKGSLSNQSLLKGRVLRTAVIQTGVF